MQVMQKKHMRIFVVGFSQIKEEGNHAVTSMGVVNELFYVK